jgi:hypothetical protein
MTALALSNVSASLECVNSNALATAYFEKGLWPSVFTFVVPGAVRKLKIFLEQQTCIEYKTSFGAAHSRIDSFPSAYHPPSTDTPTSSPSSPAKHEVKKGGNSKGSNDGAPPATKLRMSVGFADPQTDAVLSSLLALLLPSSSTPSSTSSAAPPPSSRPRSARPKK